MPKLNGHLTSTEWLQERSDEKSPCVWWRPVPRHRITVEAKWRGAINVEGTNTPNRREEIGETSKMLTQWVEDSKQTFYLQNSITNIWSQQNLLKFSAGIFLFISSYFKFRKFLTLHLDCICQKWLVFLLSG